MAKMGARSLAELVHTVDRLGEAVVAADAPPPPPPNSPTADVSRRDAPPATPR
jgi:hypothetical protein